MTTTRLPDDEIFVGIQQALATQLTADPTTLQPGTRFDDLGVDSLERVELALELEKQFSVSLDDQQVRTCQTLEGMVTIVRAAKQGQANVASSAQQEG